MTMRGKRAMAMPAILLTIMAGTRPDAVACPLARLGGLPQLDAVARGVGDPAEAADAVHVLGHVCHVGALVAELGEHGVEVADPEVEHGLLGRGTEVVGPLLERREDGGARLLP